MVNCIGDILDSSAKEQWPGGVLTHATALIIQFA